MKNLFSKLIKNDYKLQASNVWRENIENSTYYTNKPNEKEQDLKKCIQEKREHLNKRQLILDSLTIKLNLAKCDLNTELRELNNNKIKKDE